MNPTISPDKAFMDYVLSIPDLQIWQILEEELEAVIEERPVPQSLLDSCSKEPVTALSALGTGLLKELNTPPKDRHNQLAHAWHMHVILLLSKQLAITPPEFHEYSPGKWHFRETGSGTLFGKRL